MLIQGVTAEKIIEQVSKLKINIIVAASHEHGKLHSLFEGSVIKRLIGGLPCTLVLVPDGYLKKLQ